MQALCDLVAHAPVEALPLYFMALGKFVPSSAAPGPGENVVRYERWGGRNLDGITARPASVAAQKQAIDFLCSWASPDLPIEAATRLAEVFHAKPQPDALPALRRLLDHPSLTVAQEAAAALESAGEKARYPPETRARALPHRSGWKTLRHTPRGMDRQRGHYEHVEEFRGDNGCLRRGPRATRHLPRQILKANQRGDPAQPGPA